MVDANQLDQLDRRFAEIIERYKSRESAPVGESPNPNPSERADAFPTLNAAEVPEDGSIITSISPDGVINFSAKLPDGPVLSRERAFSSEKIAIGGNYTVNCIYR